MIYSDFPNCVPRHTNVPQYVNEVGDNGIGRRKASFSGHIVWKSLLATFRHRDS